MQLAQPAWLWFFAALPLLAAGAAVGRARRARDWSALGQGGRPARDGSALWLAVASCLALALAQPRWGRAERPPLPPGHDVVLALDVSRSMAATDAVPDRLGVAVESALSLVSALGRAGGDRVAVVAFAGRGVLRCPLTGNLGAAGEALRALQPGNLRPGGTDLGAGLDAALDAFDDLDHAGGRSVVVFSDGEDHAGRWRAAAERLAADGVIAHAVAVGDAEAGHPVPSRPGTDSEPVRYHGSLVLSRRTDEPLAAIARETGGAFVPLGLATTDLGRLYQTRIEPVARSRRQAVLAAEPAERFPLFLIAALAFGLAASWPRRPRPARALARGRVRAWLVALGASAATAAPGAGPGPGDDPAAVVAEGRAAYEAGRYAEALDAFRRAIRLAPGSAIPPYDAASALFQLGRHEEAQALYQEARARAGADLRTKTDFALGNTALALGDLAGAIAHYDDCLASTAPGPALDRVRRDAAVNRRFAEERLRRTLAPPDSGDSPDANRPSGRSGDRPPPDADPDRGRPSPDGPGGGQDPSNGPRTEPPTGRRGPGGAGGSGPAPPRAGSPEDQLSKAFDNVREARRRRLTETTIPDDNDDRKDW
jgi:Ca-activated chloride channel family protein